MADEVTKEVDTAEVTERLERKQVDGEWYGSAPPDDATFAKDDVRPRSRQEA